MKNFIYEQEEKIKKIIIECGYNVDNVDLVVSSRPDLGQYQFNGVMQLSKKYKKNPRLIANEIVEKICYDDDYSDVNIAGPGFINITFSDKELSDYMEKVRTETKNDICIDKNKKIIIDYGGPNVAKTLHVGHLRSANIGEALKRLSKLLNYEVISDIHLGDWGRPMGLIMLELKKRHSDWVYFDETYNGEYPQQCPIKNSDLEKLYPIASNKAKNDEQYLEEARVITAKLQHKERGYYELWKKIVEISTAEIKKIYDRLNVSFDLWNGESDADKYISTVINYLKEKGLVYESNGALVMDVSLPDDTIDVPPLLLIKSNGAVSYETTDLATLWERMHDIKPDEIWYVVDKRQSLHFEQVFRAAYKSNIVPQNVKLDFIGFGTMNGKDGKPFKTREGNIMTLSNLIESIKYETLKKLNTSIVGQEREEISDVIAIGALKYADLLPNRTTDYIFNEKRFSDSNGKTGVYLLYSTVRIKSLLDKAKDNGLQIGPIDVIVNEYDRNIALMLLQTPIVLNKAFEERTLNDIAEYLYQLTSAFNNFYSSNKILLEENEIVQQSWLGLTQNVYETNKKLLRVLGINTPKKM
jgi:arginyl-tRNA synthetase